MLSMGSRDLEKFRQLLSVLRSRKYTQVYEKTCEVDMRTKQREAIKDQEMF